MLTRGVSGFLVCSRGVWMDDELRVLEYARSNLHAQTACALRVWITRVGHDLSLTLHMSVRAPWSTVRRERRGEDRDGAKRGGGGGGRERRRGRSLELGAPTHSARGTGVELFTSRVFSLAVRHAQSPRASLSGLEVEKRGCGWLGGPKDLRVCTHACSFCSCSYALSRLGSGNCQCHLYHISTKEAGRCALRVGRTGARRAYNANRWLSPRRRLGGP
ncbi:hypothetical protein BD413DRAFT_545141 [Trametes elegans]|nr:hypothetical protein BD413DRAFT_545141 [Trametes elegans]